MITAERHGGGLRFAVVDRGPGVAPEVREHLFDRYWQPASSQKPGHGLGLFIVRGIVEAHGGQAWVESEPGRGAAFYFSIPS